jgi:hypothetical protein
MEKTEYIKSTLDVIETSILIVGEFVNFYIDYAKGNMELHSAVNKIIQGYSYSILVLPELLSGKPNGRNLKKELVKSLEDVQIAFYLSDESPEELRNTWSKFSKKWENYVRHLRSVIANQRIMYIHLN